MPRPDFREKHHYWENKLHNYLSVIPVKDLLLASWGLEAMRSGRCVQARQIANFPGDELDYRVTGKFFIAPWDFDALVNERLVLGLGVHEKHRYLDLSRWNSISKLANIFNGLSNIESVMDYPATEIISAVQRLFWPQYDWQIGYEKISRISRAWNSYVTKEGCAAFEHIHGIDLVVFLKICFGIYVLSEDTPTVNSSKLAPLGVSAKEIWLVSRVIGCDITNHCAEALEKRSNALPRSFERSQIKEKPLINDSSGDNFSFIVPSREMLMLRVTDGLYYDIVHDDNARRRSGEQFESLCRSLLEHYVPEETNVSGDLETTYGRSVDIIHTDEEGRHALLIECKSRRIPQRILTSPNPWRDCRHDFEDISKGIFQIWRSYGELMKDGGVDAVGLVLLYDPWTIMGNALIPDLFDHAAQEADDQNLSHDCKIPVVITGYFDYARCLRNYHVSDIREAIRVSAKPENVGSELFSICRELKFAKHDNANFDHGGLAQSVVGWWGRKE